MGISHWIYETFFRKGVERRRGERERSASQWKRIRQVLKDEGFRPYSNVGPFGRPEWWGGKEPVWFASIKEKLEPLGAYCLLACFSMVDNFPVLYVRYPGEGFGNEESGTYRREG